MAGNVVIVGGGIAGLSAAYDLSKAGVPHTLIEKRPRLGGVIETRNLEGNVVEAGPDSFISQKPEALALIKEVGLESEVIGSNDHQRVTYIYRHGRLVALPDGVMMIVPSKIWPMVKSPLLSWGTKIRMGFELFRQPSVEPDRSVADFVTDHFGTETLDYLAEPLLSGVYGGDPKQLSAASVLPRFVDMEAKYGSLGRAVMKAKSARKNGSGGGTLFRTLKGGMATLVDRLTPHATVRHGDAQVVERTASGFRVRVDGEWLDAASVILACPSYSAAALLEQEDGKLAALLQETPYSSSLTVAMGFRAADFNGMRAGTGFLVPQKERGRMKACTFVATKFSYRVPDDQILLRCFFGGTGDAAILDESDDSLVSIARAELKKIIGLTSAPLFSTIARWPKSMAQYTVGHAARWKQVQSRVAEIPNLYLAGNGYTGIGIPDCIRMGREAAAKIVKVNKLE